MNIAFFSLDSNLQKWIQSLGESIHLVRELKHLGGVVTDVLDKDSHREMILFLDFDWEKKKVEAFNKRICKKEDGVIRIAISSEMSIKELKKHQQGKTSCHGYIRKPLTYVILRKILEDLGCYEQYKDCFDFELPEKEEVKEKTSAKPINKEEVIEDLSNELFGLDEETAMLEESTLDSIPMIEDPEKEDSSIEESFDLGEVTADDDDDDFDLEANDDEDEDFDIDLTESSEFEAAEIKVNTVVKNLVDLHRVSGPDTPYDCELNDRIQAKFDHVFPRNEESANSSAQEPVHEHFMDPDDLHIAPITVHLDEDVENELDDLTANRKLPSPEELAEFQENTGELDLGGLKEDIEIDFEDVSDENSVVDEDSDMDLDKELDLQDHEDIDMNDENESLEIEDELDLTESSPEGELNFSDIESDEELDLSAEEETENVSFDDGFELDLSDDDSIGDLEAASEVEEDEPLSSDEDDIQLSSLGLDGEDDEGDELNLDDVELGDPIESLADSDQDEPSSFEEDELSFDTDEDEEIEATTVFDPTTDLIGESGEEDMAEDLFAVEASDDEEDAEFSVEDDSDSEDEDTTNPTMLMSQDMTDEVQNMLDDQVSTKEFRAPTPSAPNLSDSDDEDLFSEFSEESDEDLTDSSEQEDDGGFSFDSDEDDEDIDSVLSNQSNQNEQDIDQENMTSSEVEVNFGSEEGVTATMITDDILGHGLSEDIHEDNHDGEDELIHDAGLGKSEEGHLAITSQNDRIPPSFHEGEAVRLQATIRQLREERESLLDEINLLKQEKKMIEQDNLGLRAELDESRIEVSILKKRHTTDMDEMKYKLRISDEKKLYSEEKAKKLQKEFDRLQQKIRMDFNQIKVREKELEGQLELAKMDSESQVSTRDKKILDLKRKIDQLEFNMENAVIKEEKSREDKHKLEDRLERIMKTLRGSIEVLEDDLDWQVAKKDNRKP